MRSATVGVALILSSCAHSPTPEEITASHAKINQDCASRYRANGEEFRICVQQERFKLGMGGSNAHQNAALGAAGIGLLGTALMLSDQRLKRDIELLGEYRGFKLYSFRYTFANSRHMGVMAQEVRAVRPDAVHEIGGYLHVDYSKL